MQTRDGLGIEQLLEMRLRELDNERIPRFEQEVVLSGNEDPGARALLEGARRERFEVCSAIEVARRIDATPWDQELIEVGDAVDVREVDTDDVDRYVVVPTGSNVRAECGWISDRSPLGRAVVGASIGETVEVDAPAGRTRHVIIGFERAGRSLHASSK
jgi:transcription elongation GreA/GreB family factor